MIKLLVTDLDGTLLDEQKKVGMENQISVKHIKDAGLEVCLASARTYREIEHVMEILEGDFSAVSQNGSFVHTKNRVLLEGSYFESEQALNIWAIAKRFPIALFAGCADHYIYTPPKTGTYRSLEPRMFVLPRETPDFDKAIRAGLTVTKFSFYGDIKVLENLRRALTDSRRPDLSVAISDRDCLDVMPKAISKGKALDALMKDLLLTPDEVACIGDSFNDISMFGACSHSFAMEGASAEVKSQAQHVVSSVAEAAAWILSYNLGRFQNSK
ncbi:putative phosphatase YwpJ [Peptococcaceae bacterium CEB3]|nr:putative phosphatase YwpJ [Peptococcaceae bacterium CEB3]